MFGIMKLLEQLVVVARRRRLADSTIDAYCLWIRQFLRFCAAQHGGWKTPAQLGTTDVEAFLNDLNSSSLKRKCPVCEKLVYLRAISERGTFGLVWSYLGWF